MSLKTLALWFTVAFAVALGSFVGYWVCYAIGWVFLGEYNWWCLYGFSAVGFITGVASIFMFPEVILLGIHELVSYKTQTAVKLPILHKVATWFVYSLGLTLGCFLAYWPCYFLGEKFMTANYNALLLTTFSVVGFMSGVVAVVLLFVSLPLAGIAEASIKAWNSSKK